MRDRSRWEDNIKMDIKGYINMYNYVS